MRKTYSLILSFMMVLPMSACAGKSDEEMCKEMAMQSAKFQILSEAPMNASKDLIEYQIKNRLDGERLQTWTRKCVEKKTPSTNPGLYTCGMSATTLNEMYACDDKFPAKRAAR